MSFLPFLPASGPGDQDYEDTRSYIASDLKSLSQASSSDVWRTAVEDASLVRLLQSLLVYLPRPYEPGYDETLASLTLKVLSSLFATRRHSNDAPSPALRSRAVKPLLGLGFVLEAAALLGALPGSRAVLGAMLAANPRLLDALLGAGRALARSLRGDAAAAARALSDAVDDTSSRTRLAGALGGLRATLFALGALLPACPASTLRLLARQHDLLEAAAEVHDDLCPALAAWLAGQRTAHEASSASVAAASGVEALRAAAAHVELAAAALAARLLAMGPLADGGASAHDDGATGSSSGTCAVPGAASTAIGAEVVEALTACGAAQRDGAAPCAPGGRAPTLLEALAGRHGLPAALQAARSAGRLTLDDAQADYVAALLPRAWVAESKAPGDGGGASESRAAPPDLPAALTAAVCSVSEMLPEYGPGYLAACIKRAGGSAEAAVAALLDGSEGVAGLDRGADWAAYAAWKARSQPARPEAVAAAVGRGGAANPAPASTASSSGAAKGRPPQAVVARYLNVREERYHKQLQTAAMESQWEYEDEYDDSLDELAPGAGDGGSEADAGRARNDAGPERGGPAPRFADGAGARGGRGNAPPPRRWVLDGRVYNYRKEGATPVASEEHLRQVLAQAAAGRREIHGLGPGGNKPLAAPRPDLAPRMAAAAASGGQAAGQEQGRQGPDRAPGGRGGPGPRRGGGGDPASDRDRKKKDQHKAAVGNHHRKDRAAQKQNRGMAAP
ncbi:hypothetical protein ACKKBF_B33605 [Auxenochlorella protothecoides x Auxenochlorella symbiontica]